MLKYASCHQIEYCVVNWANRVVNNSTVEYMYMYMYMYVCLYVVFVVFCVAWF